MKRSKRVRLETLRDVLEFDPQTACLVSLRRRGIPEQEFIAPGADDPAFVVQYLDAKRRFRQLSSRQAERTEVRAEHDRDGTTLQARFERLGGLDIDVAITVRTSLGDRFSRWSLELWNGAQLAITDVQFPFVTTPYALGGAPGSEAILWPYYAGTLIEAPKPQDLAPDSPHTWQMRPENGDCGHYPGFTFAQFLAYYNDRAGIYLACEDASAAVKLIRPVHRGPGLRLGTAHVGDWPVEGTRKLEYEVVLGSFTGDWYAAAELYREWALQQPWAQTPLHKRADLPAWLADSPPHIILRIQGQLDVGPTEPNEEFLPYRKAIPLLDAVAKRLGSPLVPVIMSWERPGPWIYPDCFPVAGGDDSLIEFCALARERGWHVGSFCNGSRWVVGHYWTDYDGQGYLEAQQGERTICRTHEGHLWRENWDRSWRPSYACCLGVPRTHQIAADFVRTLMDLGLDWIQFFDQNVGSATFPCFAADHGHPELPGRWMSRQMRHMLDTFHHMMQGESMRSEGQRTFVLSVEAAPNETNLQDYPICDMRVSPPGHEVLMQGWVPLYHYLYHEFILIQGGFGSAPEPYHMPIRTAYNLVTGQIPGAVLTGDGRLLNADTTNWAPWEPQIGSDEDSYESLRAATALRRGPAKGWLVYGRMLTPARVEGIQTLRWQHSGRDHQIEAVFHSAWQAPDGRLALVLANWTQVTQEVRVADPRLGTRVTQHTSAKQLAKQSRVPRNGSLAVNLPPLGAVLLASH